ncbi:hypothetical protein PR048_018966 [Dryococelus australis]|uniref:Uncharacterized protein n=1 Tax=Dryococelus australis TaxID=614101 RepID=A0ABQ9H277_9NEOP|nr:hypothetical protein PR048_018966 [Dryococelus australis]
MCADSLKCFKELFTCKNGSSSASNECSNHVNRTVEPKPTTSHQCVSEEKKIRSVSSDLGISPLTSNADLEDEYDEDLVNLLDAIEKEASKIEGSVLLQNMVEDKTAAESTATCRTPCKSNELDGPHMQHQNENTPKIGPDAQESSETIPKNITTTKMSEIQKQNETTPKTGVRKPKSRIVNRNMAASTVGVHSVDTTPGRKKTTMNTTTTVRKRLNFAMQAEMPKSFKLTDVYKFLSGCEPKDAHTADGDAINLLRCIVAVGDDFLEWTDNNAHRLNEVVPRN